MNKPDLSDVTFVVPYFRDSKEREENLHFVLKWLNSSFDTNILIVESGSLKDALAKHERLPISNYEYKFTAVEDGVFHRTKQINAGIKKATTPYVAIWDTDVFCDDKSVVEAVELLREGVTLAYPYNGTWCDVERLILLNGVIKERESRVLGSFGGACFLNKADYMKCGLENEFLAGGWVHDDVERYERVKKLGYKTARTEGNLYHIMHEPTKASKSNPSDEEYRKIKEMSREELLDYVNESFIWAK